MTKELTLREKLIEMQRELKAPKGQYNKFGKYNYRSAEDILEAVKPINSKYGVLLTISDDIIQVGERVYVKATAKLTDDKDSVIVTAFAREALDKKGMDDSQITGAASSYAHKYALNGLYLIDDTKDADTDEYTNQNNQAPQAQQQERQVGKEILLSKYLMSGKTEDEFENWYKEQLAKGHTNNHIDQALTIALQRMKEDKNV